MGFEMGFLISARLQPLLLLMKPIQNETDKGEQWGSDSNSEETLRGNKAPKPRGFEWVKVEIREGNRKTTRDNNGLEKLLPILECLQTTEYAKR